MVAQCVEGVYADLSAEAPPSRQISAVGLGTVGRVSNEERCGETFERVSVLTERQSGDSSRWGRRLELGRWADLTRLRGKVRRGRPPLRQSAERSGRETQLWS